MKRLLLIGFVALAPMSAHGAFDHGMDWENGNSLATKCMAKDFNINICYGYLDGIASALSVNKLNGYEACIPVGVTSGQLLDIVLRSLWTHPEDRHNAAVGLVARALQDAYPCRRSNS